MTLPAAEAIFLALSGRRSGRSRRLPRRALRGRRRAAARRRSRSCRRSICRTRTSSIPSRIPSLDMAAVDGPLQPGTTPRRLSRAARARVRRHGRRLCGAAGSAAPHGGDQGAAARLPPSARSSAASSTKPKCSAACSIPGSRRCTPFAPGDRATPAYLVMELVSGPPLTDYARAHQLSIADRVELDRQARRGRAARARSRRHPSRSQAGQRARRRRRPAQGPRLRDRARDRRRRPAHHPAHRARAIDGDAGVHEPGATARALRRGRRAERRLCARRAALPPLDRTPAVRRAALGGRSSTSWATWRLLRRISPAGSRRIEG